LPDVYETPANCRLEYTGVCDDGMVVAIEYELDTRKQQILLLDSGLKLHRIIGLLTSKVIRLKDKKFVHGGILYVMSDDTSTMNCIDLWLKK
jgi:hypothetical protein